jgi:hypothetical protein
MEHVLVALLAGGAAFGAGVLLIGGARVGRRIGAWLCCECLGRDTDGHG